MLIVSAVGFGASLVLFAASPLLAIAMVCVLAVGFFNASYMTQNQTMLQMIVPSEMRGRVLGVYMLDRGLMPLGSLLVGMLAHWLGAPIAVAVMGGLCVAIAITIAMFTKELWRFNLISRTEPVKTPVPEKEKVTS